MLKVGRGTNSRGAPLRPPCGRNSKVHTWLGLGFGSGFGSGFGFGFGLGSRFGFGFGEGEEGLGLGEDEREGECGSTPSCAATLGKPPAARAPGTGLGLGQG